MTIEPKGTAMNYGHATLAAALALAACGQENTTNPSIDVDEGAEITVDNESPPSKAVVQTAQKDPFGYFLSSADGRSLYIFKEDTQGSDQTPPKSACTGPCTEQWPPLTSEEPPEAVGGAVQGEMLSTFTREDGSTQVAYNGWPLYHYYVDQEPGYTEGHATHDTWGGWHLISASGEVIETTAE
jgi:predicted lipoprotein with Yx(FWY)xxD motif